MSDLAKTGHLVVVNAEARRLEIYRWSLGSDEHVLYTSVELPEKKADDDPMAFGEFARLLGENILLDSPVARNILGL